MCTARSFILSTPVSFDSLKKADPDAKKAADHPDAGELDLTKVQEQTDAWLKSEVGIAVKFSSWAEAHAKPCPRCSANMYPHTARVQPNARRPLRFVLLCDG